jgi:hypothetical protein
MILMKRRPPTSPSARTNGPVLSVVQTILVASACFVLFQSASGNHRMLNALDGIGVVDAQSRSLKRYGSPFEIPEGEAEALPSIRIEDVEEVERGIYGGKGDKQHLGGFTTYDGMGVSPAVWKYMIKDLGVKSLMDVGCGKVCGIVR